MAAFTYGFRTSVLQQLHTLPALGIKAAGGFPCRLPRPNGFWWTGPWFILRNPLYVAMSVPLAAESRVLCFAGSCVMAWCWGDGGELCPAFPPTACLSLRYHGQGGGSLKTPPSLPSFRDPNPRYGNSHNLRYVRARDTTEPPRLPTAQGSFALQGCRPEPDVSPLLSHGAARETRGNFVLSIAGINPPHPASRKTRHDHASPANNVQNFFGTCDP